VASAFATRTRLTYNPTSSGVLPRRDSQLLGQWRFFFAPLLASVLVVTPTFEVWAIAIYF
jgi:hypothetical protein